MPFWWHNLCTSCWAPQHLCFSATFVTASWIYDGGFTLQCPHRTQLLLTEEFDFPTEVSGPEKNPPPQGWAFEDSASPKNFCCPKYSCSQKQFFWTFNKTNILSPLKCYTPKFWSMATGLSWEYWTYVGDCASGHGARFFNETLCSFPSSWKHLHTLDSPSVRLILAWAEPSPCKAFLFVFLTVAQTFGRIEPFPPNQRLSYDADKSWVSQFIEARGSLQ